MLELKVMPKIKILRARTKHMSGLECALIWIDGYICKCFFYRGGVLLKLPFKEKIRLLESLVKYCPWEFSKALRQYGSNKSKRDWQAFIRISLD